MIAIDDPTGKGRRMNGRENRRHRGTTLVAVTTIGVIVGLLAAAMVQLGYHARMLAVRNVQGISARAAADAGMAEAVFKMQKKLITEAGWDNSTLPTPAGTSLDDLTSATYTFTITGDIGTGWLIDATGTCGGQSRSTHTQLDIGSYWEGIGVENEVDVKLGTTFGVINGIGSDMTIRSNSTIADTLKFKAFVTVPGDVICGPGGDPETVIDVKASTVIQGEVYAASEELEFPPVAPPAGTAYVGTPITSTTTIAGGSWQYDEINLGNSAVLTITAPTVLYVTGQTILGNSSEVVVEPGGSLALYLGSDLINNNSTGFFNGTNDSTKLKIYGLPTCTEIDLKAKSDLFAAVYAPSADIDLYNSGDFYGAITADSFEMKNSGNFYFDVSLMTTTIEDPAAVFTVGRWWEN